MLLDAINDACAYEKQPFWKDSLRYLDLPRLKARETLAAVVRTGASSRDFFGTAYGFENGKYEGFSFGTGGVSFDDTLDGSRDIRHSARRYGLDHGYFGTRQEACHRGNPACPEGEIIPGPRGRQPSARQVKAEHGEGLGIAAAPLLTLTTSEFPYIIFP